MNDAHFHLVVNHLPIIFPLIGTIVLATGLIFKSEAIKRTSYMIFVLGAIAAVFAMNSGEGAEEVIENMGGNTKKFIHIHEEAAETLAIFSYVVASFSLLGFWASYKQKSFSNIISIAILVLAFVLLFYAKQTGTTGGEIRHTEIRTVINETILKNGSDKD